MPYYDLREFIEVLEKKGLLKRVKTEVDPVLEIAAIQERLVKSGGPAVLFEKVKGHRMAVLGNLFGTAERVALGLGVTEEELSDIGQFIATLQRPQPPEGLWDAVKKIPFFGKILTLGPKTVKSAPCQDVVETDTADLSKIPIIKCWPGDAAPLITWPLVVTQSPQGGPYNVGVYRMQYLDGKRAIMRWLSHRGGATHQRLWEKEGKAMPVAVAIGCDPATIIAGVTPVPEDVGEFHFAGVLRKKAIELVECKTIPLKVPATAEIIIEGEIRHGELEMEGPFGDHTGYYNAAEPFPVFHVKAITHRKDAIYMTTITGRPPKEDAVIGTVLNKLYLPSLKLQFPEVVDFCLPMEAVSYRIAVVSIKKEYPGHARRIMMGLWGVLKQFMYVKYIIVVDDDVDVHNWTDVIWAISTRVDPKRDTLIIENTPIDYLDFSSPIENLGSKMGIDATNKYPPEVSRKWGEKMEMDSKVEELVEKKWKEYGF
ncbi:MAG TPA: menaquinone biosynthesis decarboxylase [Deltaproteobacteria bacterium]|nr:MAG: menaquinone biosynthesis decarboxylase [Deltaproteobacteria bacterium GWA2_55_82]OGQ62081.1 MAG: menaquinone biosynthesis decarboxylase [Deltaproteobacteria bacterium RIFCSPLOWO2_02_FULL_55_12]OIJ74059.1 MAG: menaquinone biosynthesis decarboxylase [Deltaproteobacteria bacterium GWC2_55_46]HBG46670.1 menaquinone biosynthesis decarboxylase [Deltaproteobacteria bacterium]HCY11322.1 menaquinone biosynthesis decarboxylase [Deltaproteobacteria bacterium]